MVMEVFSRAAAKPEGRRSDNAFIDAILRERPDLEGENVFVPGQGTYGHVVFIGDEVFKGPQSIRSKTSDEVIAGIDEETAVLQSLSGKGLPVPEVTCVGRESVFFGMTRVPGRMLGEDFEKMYSAEEQRQLAQDIIGFVVDMANAVPQRDGKFLSHDDLNCRNIFVDPRTRRLSGVIDFGLTRYCTKDEWWPRGSHSNEFFDMLEAEFRRREADIPGPIKPLPPRRASRLLNSPF